MTLADSPLAAETGAQPDAAEVLAAKLFESKLWPSATGLDVHGLLQGIGANASTAKGRVAAFFGERFAPSAAPAAKEGSTTREEGMDASANTESSDPEWTPADKEMEEKEPDAQPPEDTALPAEPSATAACVEPPLLPVESLIGAHLSWRSAAVSLQQSLDVASVYLASAMGGEEPLRWFEVDACDPEKLKEPMAAVLRGMMRGLEACDLRLKRLAEEFDCLDDGEAEGLFGSEGKLKEDLEEIEAVRSEIEEFARRGGHWQASSSRALGHIVGIEAIADFVGEAVPVLDDFVGRCGHFAARRRAAVARAKAAIESADASERATAVAMLQDALSPPSRVDFPRVTEICQRVADRPDEVAPSAAVLWAALSSSDEDADSPRRQLKALTIAHELLYDDGVLAAFAALETAPLRGLEVLPEGTTLGKPAEEALRMLATEVRRRVEEKQDTVARTSRRRATWSFPALRRGGGTSGDSEGSPVRQPKLRSSKSAPLEAASLDMLGPEALLRTLRRWGSWYHIGGKQERHTLLELRSRFLGLLDGLARVREELDCLDDGSTGMELQRVVAQMEPLLLSASDFQARACAWCEALKSSGGSPVACVSPTSASSSVDVEVPLLDPEQLADFLEEALAVFVSLSRRLQGYTALRREAVERAKALIEAGPIADFEGDPCSTSWS